MKGRELSSRILITVGRILLLAGAIDPMEGALLILPGSALIALGTFLSGSERRWLGYRTLAFILVAAGVGALFGLSAVGGFGGPGGRSVWWGLLILPYLVGWSMSVWGPGSPRWALGLGIGVGAWYLAIFGMQLTNGRPGGITLPVIVIALLGVLTIGGCIVRLAYRPTAFCSR